MVAAGTAGRRPACERGATPVDKEDTMSKRGRKRRARKKSGANHGNRPNA